MDLVEKVTIRSGLVTYPKAKPLAEGLIAEAIRQGVTLGEFKLATELAIMSVEKVMDPELRMIEGVERDAYAALESV